MGRAKRSKEQAKKAQKKERTGKTVSAVERGAKAKIKQEKAKKKALTDKANREIKLKKESKQKMDKERRAKIPKIYATVTRHIEKSGKAVKAVGAAEKKLKGATSERSKKALGKALKEK